MKDKYKAALEKYENNEINETQFNLTKDQYDRLLVKSGFLRDEIRMAQENLSENVIRLKQAELKLQKTSIISPFPGIVAELKASPGEIISAGTEVIKVVNLKSIYLKGFALESELVNLKTGINVRIKFDSFPNRYFSGVLDAVSPEVDAEKKLITVYVKVANPDNMILPGMHAEIDVEYEVFDNVLKVPRQAIVMRGQGDRPTIFVIKDSIALWKYVELGAKNDEEQIVTGEIEEGDLVVIDGHMTLGHQSKVTITETVQ
jgi:RND family efflux transporter MFP subunit